MAAVSRRLSCGLEVCCPRDLKETLMSATSNGFDFIVIPIIHPRQKRELVCGKAKDRKTPLTRSDLLLNGNDWSNLIVAKLSPYLNVDSPNDAVRQRSERTLEQELQYASHLSVSAVMLPSLTGRQPNLARFVYSRVQSAALFHGSFQVWVRVPMQASVHFSKDWLQTQIETLPEDEDYGEDTWHWWHFFRTICGTHRKVGIALELSSDLPCEDVILRWLGEPIRCLVVPTSVFVTNKKGYPVLSLSHQSVVKKFYLQDIQILITGNERSHDMKRYHQYMDFMFQVVKPPRGEVSLKCRTYKQTNPYSVLLVFSKNQSPEDPVTQFARGYEDYLQCPLQPLMDNLEAQTYETFERDPVKYSEYKKAIYHAILDKVPFDEKETKVLVVMVVGAGRGPLVHAALSAADNANRKIKVYAVEKNPNAIVTLLSTKAELWRDSVTVVSKDMREWDAPEKADILISELLGSFGDNELSPECLDGAQKFLKDDGVSIPESYTSHLSPIQSPKLYCEVRVCRDREKGTEKGSAFETPYVVRLHNKVELSEPKPLFTFHHPNKEIVIDNSKFKCLRFPIEMDSVLHGFAGYFDTVLYKNIILSIVPRTHSKGMFSWFPMYFPIKYPIYLRQGCEVEVNFWRRVSSRNVWYEWCVTNPEVSMIHNVNGRAYTIGL